MTNGMFLLFSSKNDGMNKILGITRQSFRFFLGRREAALQKIDCELFLKR